MYVLLAVGWSKFIMLDFKLSQCSECCMLFSRWFTGACNLNVNVSEHSVCSVFTGVYSYSPVKTEQTACSGTLAFKLQTPVNHPKGSTQLHYAHTVYLCASFDCDNTDYLKMIINGRWSKLHFLKAATCFGFNLSHCQATVRNIHRSLINSFHIYC
jgi:hypothetical protein